MTDLWSYVSDKANKYSKIQAPVPITYVLVEEYKNSFKLLACISIKISRAGHLCFFKLCKTH